MKLFKRKERPVSGKQLSAISNLKLQKNDTDSLTHGLTDSQTHRLTSYFSLIELITAMVVFTLIMAVMMGLFRSAQQSWTRSNERTTIFENANLAMDLISRDLQCAVYDAGDAGAQPVFPFWHVQPVTPTLNTREMLAFVSLTPTMPNDECTSRLCEIKYKLYYTTDNTGPNLGWLMRSVTGNRGAGGVENDKYTFQSNFEVETTENGDDDDLDGKTYAAFTIDYTASADFRKVIPYVTHLSFVCFDKNQAIIDPDTTGTADTEFPAMIKVTLSLLAKNAWIQWIERGGKPQKIYWSHNADKLHDDDPASAFRKKHERTFTKLIFLLDRDQSSMGEDLGE